METTLISWAISTSVIQRYKISKRNANPLTLVNTNIILHFSSFFGSENGVDIMNYFGNNIGVDPSEIYACIAPVGGPTTTKSHSPNIQMREKQHDELNNLW